MPFFFRGESVKYLIQTVTIKVSPIRFRLISDVDKTFISRVMHSLLGSVTKAKEYVLEGRREKEKKKRSACVRVILVGEL